MRFIIYIMALAGTLNLFTACSKVEDLPQEEEFGYLSLALGVSEPNRFVTKVGAGSVDVNTFSVDIKSGETVVKHFDTFQDLKRSGTLRLPVGAYKVVVSQPGIMAPISDAPYYAGVKDITIEKNAFTSDEKATVICTMRQVRIKVKFEPDFLAAIVATPTDVKITNGTDEYIFNKIVSNESEDVYIKPTSEGLQISFSCTEKEYGEPYTYDQEVKKSDGKSPEANDFLTITIGLEKVGTKTLSTLAANPKFNIKVTVE